MRGPRLDVRDPRWCASWAAGVVLVLLCVAVYVPGLFSLPAVDRDEARFAQASRQMFESLALSADAPNPEYRSGGLVVPMIQDRPRLNKPPLIYWLQAGSAAVFTGGDPTRDAIWMYRVPSVLAAIASVLMLWRLGLSMFDPRAAFLAAVMLAVCPLFVWEAHQARADHLLTACTIGAMWALWQIWNAGRRGTRVGPVWPAVLWISLALGLLTKGPITPMVAGLCVLVLGLLTRRWGWLRGVRAVSGLVIAGAIVAPWLYLLMQRYGVAEYLALVYDETLGRAGSPQEKHAGPPGYHLVLLIVVFWPGSMVTGLAVCRAWSRTIRGVRPWKWRALAPTRSRGAELFCLCWVLPSWIVFELSATKLPHYTMPLLPALALLSARTLLAVSAGSVGSAFGRLQTTVFVLWIGVTAAAGVVALATSLLLFDSSWSGSLTLAVPLSIVFLLLQAALLVRSASSIVRRKPARALRAALASAVITWTCVLGIILPHAPSLWPTRALGRALVGIDPARTRPLATLYREDSVIFETRGRAQRIEADPGVSVFVGEHTDALVILRQSELARLTFLRPLAYIRGFNMARMQRERLAIAELDPRDGVRPDVVPAEATP